MTSGHMEFGVEVAGRHHSPELLVLPQPRQHGGKPLLEALKLRRSRRDFSRQELPLEVLSSLLWAAFGVNRPDTGGRTAPSAHDWEEIDLFVATPGGLYVYDAREHLLRKRLDRDIRAQTRMQSFAGEAPVDLVYVADLARMAQASAEERA